MSFDIFNYRDEQEELKDMLKQLTEDNYAVSDIPYDVILQYTLNLKYAVKLTRRRNGTVKVKRQSMTSNKVKE